MDHDRGSVRVAAEKLIGVGVKWTGSLEVRLAQAIHGSWGVVAFNENWNGDICAIQAWVLWWIVWSGILVAIADLPNIASLLSFLGLGQF